MILIVFLVFGLYVPSAHAQFNLCPEPDGDFPNPASERCTTFFRCVNNSATLLRCPAMRTFDFLFRSCRRGTQLHCERQLELFTVPTDPPPADNPDPQPAVRGAQGVNPVTTFLGGAGGGATAAEGGATGLGAGLPNAGLLNILTLLEDGGGGRRGRRRGRNDNDLATLMVFSSLMNQMNTSPNSQQLPQQPQQPQYQQPPLYQQHQPWNPQLQQRQQPQQQLQPQQPLPVVPDSGLLPASAVLPSAANINQRSDRNRKAVSVQEAGGQISRLPDGKTVVVIPQPIQAGLT